MAFNSAIRHAPATGPTAKYITHMFDLCCRQHGIEHRTTKVNHPWTNGQVERMNRSIKEATIKRYHYSSHDKLKAHMQAFLMATASPGGLKP